jgi:hypothetical protein
LHHQIPSVVLPYSISIPAPHTAFLAKHAKPAFTIHFQQEPRPLATLPEVDFSASYSSSGQQPLLDKSFWLLPTQNVLVQVPRSKDSLLVHDIDIEAGFKELGIDRLFVLSAPPAAFSEGEKVNYQLVVDSKNGGLKYSLATGPAGMKIDAQGKLSWSAPLEAEHGKIPVSVVVRDQSGQEIRHDFKLQCVNAGENKRNRLSQEAAERRRLHDAKMLQERLKSLPDKATKAKAEAERMAEATLREFEEPDHAPAQVARHWTDTKGNTVEGELLDLFAGTIDLKLQDGRTIRVPVANLSPADQALVDQFQKAKLKRKRELSALDPIFRKLQIIGSGFKRFCRNRKRMYKAYTADRQGKPLLSWRVHLLPALGAGDLYALFRTNEPWDSPNNRELIKYMPDFYHAAGTDTASGKTTFLAIRGPSAVIPAPAKAGQPVESTRAMLERAKTFLPHRPDDQQRNIAVVAAPPSAAVAWTKPDDWDSLDSDSIKRLFDSDQGGFFAIMDDGSVRLISDQIPLEKIQLLFDRTNRQQVDLDPAAAKD